MSKFIYNPMEGEFDVSNTSAYLNEPIQIQASELRKMALKAQLIPEQRYSVNYSERFKYLSPIFDILKIRTTGVSFPVIVRASSAVDFYEDAVIDDTQYSNYKIKFDLYGHTHAFSSIDPLSTYVPQVTKLIFDGRKATFFTSPLTGIDIYQIGELESINLGAEFGLAYGGQADGNKMYTFNKIYDFPVHNGVITWMQDTHGNEAYCDWLCFYRHTNLPTMEDSFLPILVPINDINNINVNYENNKIGPFYLDTGYSTPYADLLLGFPPVSILPFDKNHRNISNNTVKDLSNSLFDLFISGNNNTVSRSASGILFGENNNIEYSTVTGLFIRSNLKNVILPSNFDYQDPYIAISDSVLENFSLRTEARVSIQRSELRNVTISQATKDSPLYLQECRIKNCQLSECYGYNGILGNFLSNDVTAPDGYQALFSECTFNARVKALFSSAVSQYIFYRDSIIAPDSKSNNGYTVIPLDEFLPTHPSGGSDTVFHVKDGVVTLDNIGNLYPFQKVIFHFDSNYSASQDFSGFVVPSKAVPIKFSNTELGVGNNSIVILPGQVYLGFLIFPNADPGNILPGTYIEAIFEDVSNGGNVLGFVAIGRY